MSLIEPTRRSLITGLVSFVAAPALVRAGSLMPVSPQPLWGFFKKGELVPDWLLWTENADGRFGADVIAWDDGVMPIIRSQSLLEAGEHLVCMAQRDEAKSWSFGAANAGFIRFEGGGVVIRGPTVVKPSGFHSGTTTANN